MIRLPIADIQMSEQLQPRVEIDHARILEYAERMNDGDSFPPVVVFYDGLNHWLADGYHRLFAARQSNRTHINVKVYQGSVEDAQWYSYSANKTHGVPRSNKDKRRAVEAALIHPQRSKLTNRQLAIYLGVSHEYITRVEKDLSIDRSIDRSSEREVTRNGTTYTMNVANIRNVATESEHEPQSPTLFDEPDPSPPPVPVPTPIIEPEPTPEPPKALTLEERGIYTLGYWNELSLEEQLAIIELGSHTPTDKRFNSQQSDNIEWARWSWNPVTGCYHNCIYCYARDLANRHYEQKFDASFLPDRLAIPRSFQPPAEAAHLVGYRNVFTCSMADLFGKWVPQQWIDAVLNVVTDAPQWNFLFLTKFPIRLAEQDWPDNAWVGCTVDTQARVASAERAFSKVKAGIKWLSCEPLLEPLKFNSLEMFDWVVIGGQSRSTQAPEFQPQWEWVERLVEQARAAGCKVYFKTNLLARPKEYPFEVPV